METLVWWLLLVLLAVLIVVIASMWYRGVDGWGELLGVTAEVAEGVVIGGGASRSEDATRDIFVEIFDAKFPTARPDWLGGLELDGYNERLGVGFEFQGPQHTKFSPRYDGDYLGYARRVTDDRYKVAMSEDMGKCLVIVDYVVKSEDVYDYVVSRLYDYYTRHKAWCIRRKWPEWLGVRPRPYLKRVVHRAYTKFGNV